MHKSYDHSSFILLCYAIAKLTTLTSSLEPTAPSIKPSNAYLKIADRSTLVKIIIGDTLKTSGGRDIEIKCPITGYPLPEPLWKHGDTMLKPHENTVINAEEQTLLLKSVDEWQSGTYSCFATNFAGVAVVTSKLKILRKLKKFCFVLVLRSGETRSFFRVGAMQHAPSHQHETFFRVAAKHKI